MKYSALLGLVLLITVDQSALTWALPAGIGYGDKQINPLPLPLPVPGGNVPDVSQFTEYPLQPPAVPFENLVPPTDVIPDPDLPSTEPTPDVIVDQITPLVTPENTESVSTAVEAIEPIYPAIVDPAPDNTYGPASLFGFPAVASPAVEEAIIEQPSILKALPIPSPDTTDDAANPVVIEETVIEPTPTSETVESSTPYEVGTDSETPVTIEETVIEPPPTVEEAEVIATDSTNPIVIEETIIRDTETPVTPYKTIESLPTEFENFFPPINGNSLPEILPYPEIVPPTPTLPTEEYENHVQTVITPVTTASGGNGFALEDFQSLHENAGNSFKPLFQFSSGSPASTRPVFSNIQHYTTTYTKALPKPRTIVNGHHLQSLSTNNRFRYATYESEFEELTSNGGAFYQNTTLLDIATAIVKKVGEAQKAVTPVLAKKIQDTTGENTFSICTYSKGRMALSRAVKEFMAELSHMIAVDANLGHDDCRLKAYRAFRALRDSLREVRRDFSDSNETVEGDPLFLVKQVEDLIEKGIQQIVHQQPFEYEADPILD